MHNYHSTEVAERTVRDLVIKAVNEVKVTDIHTHLYASCFGSLSLSGIDEMLTYHYLVAEAMRWLTISYRDFWALSKKEQAELVWKTLFIDHVPYSEVCVGLLTVLRMLGMDTTHKELKYYRKFFAGKDLDAQIDRTLELSGVESLVMTNDPFDPVEREIWLKEPKVDSRFCAALRLDVLLNDWPAAAGQLAAMKYDVSENLDRRTVQAVRKFLREWMKRTDSLYMAVSLPPDFAFPDESTRSRLISECVLPVAEGLNVPLAMMIGVRRAVNPDLKLAGDAGGRSDISAVENLCSSFPASKFLVTMIARENQQELCIAARKFRNLMIFGCWWFMNNPSLIDEVTRMRLEMLGPSVIPQHSDARVLEQLIYKWSHSREIIGEALADRYVQLARTGWEISPAQIKADVEGLFGENFWAFCRMRL